MAQNRFAFFQRFLLYLRAGFEAPLICLPKRIDLAAASKKLPGTKGRVDEGEKQKAEKLGKTISAISSARLSAL